MRRMDSGTARPVRLVTVPPQHWPLPSPRLNGRNWPIGERRRAWFRVEPKPVSRAFSIPELQRSSGQRNGAALYVRDRGHAVAPSNRHGDGSGNWPGRELAAQFGRRCGVAAKSIRKQLLSKLG